jgi:negative regulator of sigma E activity
MKEVYSRQRNVDGDEFKARVSSAVRREAATTDRDATDAREAAIRQRAARRTWRRTAKWFATVGAPLAAAAIIAIAVWWPGAVEVVSQHGLVPPAKPLVLVALDMPETSGRVAITFEQGPGGEPQANIGGEDQRHSDVGGGVAVAIGSSAAEPAESVDEVLF